MRLRMMIALLFMGYVIGCSSEPAAVDVKPVASPAKALLEEVAKTGELGSGAMDIDTALNKMKSTDGAKADKLLKEFGELKTAKSPDEVKSKAKAMADQL